MSNSDVDSTFVFYLASIFGDDVEPISVFLYSYFKAIYNEGTGEQNRIFPNLTKPFFCFVKGVFYRSSKGLQTKTSLC